VKQAASQLPVTRQMLTDLKILLQADATATLQQIFVENAIISQMPSYSALRFIVDNNTCFRLLLVF